MSSSADLIPAPKQFRGEWYEDDDRDFPWKDEIGTFPTLKDAVEASIAYVNAHGGSYEVKELQMLPPDIYLLCDPAAALANQPEVLQAFYQSAEQEKILLLPDGTHVFAAHTGADGVFVNWDGEHSVQTDTAIIAVVASHLADKTFDKDSVDSIATAVWTSCQADKENESIEILDSEWPINYGRQMVIQGVWAEEELVEAPDPQLEIAETWIKQEFRQWLKQLEQDSGQAEMWAKIRESLPLEQKTIYQLARCLELFHQGRLSGNDIYMTFKKGYSALDVKISFESLISAA